MSNARKISDLVSTSPTEDFNYDNGVFVVDISTDRVGVGASTPASKLDVRGTVQVGVDDTGYDVKFFGATSGKSWLWDESADKMIVTGDTQLTGTLTVGVDDTGHDVKFFGATSGSYMLWDESADSLIVDGKVGIGVTDPDVELEIKKSSANVTLAINAATAANDAQLKFRTGDTDDFTIYIDGSATNDPLHFYDHASSTNMMTLVNGNVGIGTTSPQKHLEISDDGTSGNIPTIRLNSTEPNVGLNDTIGIVDWKSADSSRGGDPAASIKAISSIAGGSHTDLLFSTGEDGTAAAEKMRITSVGRVGIGNSEPDHELVIGAASPGADLVNTIEMRGSAGDSSLQRFHIVNQGDTGKIHFKLGRSGNAPSTFMTVGNSGEIGINSTAPTQTLTVDGTVGGTAIKDEDNMSSNSATHLATQQSIKAYVDAQIAANSGGSVLFKSTGKASGNPASGKTWVAFGSAEYKEVEGFSYHNSSNQTRYARGYGYGYGDAISVNTGSGFSDDLPPNVGTVNWQFTLEYDNA